MSEYSAPTQFIDLEAQQKKIRVELERAIKRVLDHGQYIMGPEVGELSASCEILLVPIMLLPVLMVLMP